MLTRRIASFFSSLHSSSTRRKLRERTNLKRIRRANGQLSILFYYFRYYYCYFGISRRETRTPRCWFGTARVLISVTVFNIFFSNFEIRKCRWFWANENDLFLDNWLPTSWFGKNLSWLGSRGNVGLREWGRACVLYWMLSWSYRLFVCVMYYFYSGVNYAHYLRFFEHKII